jgi:hypothetical protein
MKYGIKWKTCKGLKGQGKACLSLTEARTIVELLNMKHRGEIFHEIYTRRII